METVTITINVANNSNLQWALSDILRNLATNGNAFEGCDEYMNPDEAGYYKIDSTEQTTTGWNVN